MNKTALCIGISDYDFASKLKNPLNDTDDIGGKLSKLGFEITLVKNPDRIGLLREINNYKEKALLADVSVIYYAGHSIQSNGINFIIPKDANPQNEAELDFFCISIDSLVPQDQHDDYKTNIFIFDACRDNPFSRTWSRSTSTRFLGFAPILAPSGTLIAFSTSPGKAASDGKNRNGLYTESLLSEITKPDLSIIQVFQNVRQKVLFQSNNEQLPWESTSLLGDFYFNSKAFNLSDTKIISIRKNVANTEESIFMFEKKEIDIMDESTEDGMIFKYSFEGKIKKIERQLFFESGRFFEDIYFKNNYPIYYRVSKHKYNVPFNINEDLAAEIGSESFDENKTRIDIEEYFISDNSLIGINKIEENDSQEIDKALNEKVIKEIKRIIEQCKN